VGVPHLTLNNPSRTFQYTYIHIKNEIIKIGNTNYININNKILSNCSSRDTSEYCKMFILNRVIGKPNIHIERYFIPYSACVEVSTRRCFFKQFHRDKNVIDTSSVEFM